MDADFLDFARWVVLPVLLTFILWALFGCSKGGDGRSAPSGCFTPRFGMQRRTTGSLT